MWRSRHGATRADGFLNPELIRRMRGYFKPTAVQRLFDEHLRGYRDHSGPIWPLLMLELWHRNFLEKAPDFSRIPSLVGARR
ncbi:MAG TPA: asparagine synthase-related protein [Candidatus Sulfotelmatobacter sp.]|nr:asparagine synthase-related protein [Candidatus Sulfotelmatobacter sp.]